MQLASILAPFLSLAIALPTDTNGASSLEKREPLSLMDFKLTNMKTQCSRRGVELDWTCALTYRWQDPNWSNTTAPECIATFHWDGVRNMFSNNNQDLSICWRDTNNPRMLPVFQHSITSFTTPGEFTLGLVDHVVDDSLTEPWDVRACFSYPQIMLPLVYESDLKIEYGRDDIVQAIITGMSS